GDVESDEHRERDAEKRDLNERPDRFRIARRDELATRAEQHEEDDERADRLLVVEALREVGERRGDEERDGELPRALLSACKPPREPQQHQAEREREHTSRLREPLRQYAADEVEAVCHLRRRRRDHANETEQGRRPGEEQRRSNPPHGHRVEPGDEGSVYSRTRAWRSSSSLPGSRITSTESPDSSLSESSGTSALPLRTTEITREPSGRPTLAIGRPTQPALPPTQISSITRFSLRSSR